MILHKKAKSFIYKSDCDLRFFKFTLQSKLENSNKPIINKLIWNNQATSQTREL